MSNPTRANEPQRDHNLEDDVSCWCKPDLYYVTDGGNNLWVHREPDDEPPLEVLFDALASVAWDDYEE